MRLMRGKRVLARGSARGKGATAVTVRLSQMRHVAARTLTLKLTVGGDIAAVRRLQLHR